MPKPSRARARRAIRLFAPAPRAAWIVVAGLGLAVAAIYLQTGGFDFVTFDDGLYVSANPVVRAGLTRAGVVWAFRETHLGFWIPTTWLSLMGGVSIFGPSAGAAHLVNAAVHFANAALLFGVLRRLTGEIWPSALVGALFAVHPLHVESVAWVTERKDVLCALFWLLAIWSHARAIDRPSARARTVVIVFAALAMTSKPMAVTLPLTLLILDDWPLDRLRLRPLDLLVYEKLPIFAISAAVAVVTARSHGSGGATPSLAQIPLGLRLENAVVSYAEYLAKAVWPVRLAVFYPYPSSIPLWKVAAAVAALGAITALAMWQRRRRPYLLAGWIWYLVTLLPVAGLLQAGEQSMADRFAYVPLVGIWIMVAWSARDLVAARPVPRPVAMTAAAVVVVLLGARAWDQTRTWRDGRTLFAHALAVAPDNALARHDLGRALADAGDDDGAIENYEAALRLDPSRASTNVALGAALQRRGRADDAQRAFEEALRLDPSSAEAHNNLGLVLASAGDREGARAHYDEALRLEPNDVDALVNLASLLYAEGDRAAAISTLERAVALDPFHATARYNLRQLRGR